MKILIFGMGQVGTQLHDFLIAKGESVVGLDSSLDIRDAKAVDAAVEEHAPEVVINAVAKTSIDWCEENKTESFAVNTLGAENIGKACASRNVYLVHVSSGCVQESPTADIVHKEEDPPTPLCFYAWTKVWAEELLLSLVKRNSLKVLIVRPRQLISASPSRVNALVKMLTYKQFIDTAQSCTVVEDLLRVVYELMNHNATGIYNVVNPGTLTPYEIAGMLKEIIDPTMEFRKISKDELNQITRVRRIDTVLSTEKLNALGITLPEIHGRIRAIIETLRDLMRSGGGEEILAKTRQDTIKKVLQA